MTNVSNMAKPGINEAGSKTLEQGRPSEYIAQIWFIIDSSLLKDPYHVIFFFFSVDRI